MVTADRKFLLLARWTVDHEERDGFVKRVYWRDPVNGSVLIQHAAINCETKRQYQALKKATNEQA